jgi:hypothetical protein
LKGVLIFTETVLNSGKSLGNGRLIARSGARQQRGEVQSML